MGWGKVIKWDACRAFYHFRNELNKFNDTRAQMLDSIYHMTLKLLKNRIFGVKTSTFCHILRSVIMDLIT